MPTITALQPIKHYGAPQYLVEPSGPPMTGDAFESEVEVIEEHTGYDVVESTVVGWYEYNAIIAVDDDECGIRHYLARLEGSEISA